MHPEQQYLNTLHEILTYGERVENRTGVDTLRLLGVMHRYDFKHGFPLFTTKRTWFKGIAHELLWFLSGSTNIKYLVDNGVNIWNEDAYRHYEYSGPVGNISMEDFLRNVRDEPGGLWDAGDVGPIYGSQWRYWHMIEDSGVPGKCDQIRSLIDGLRHNPASRRHILTAWNPPDIPTMALPPCHVLSQYSISNGKLWCHMYQRSCDMPLGVPFNVASYALLTHILAHVCDLEPGGLIHTMHDCHIYVNQIDGVQKQLTRDPLPFPVLGISNITKDIDQIKYEHLSIKNYKHHGKIDMPLST